MRAFVIAPDTPDGRAVEKAFVGLGHDCKLFSYAEFAPDSLFSRLLGRIWRGYRIEAARRSFNTTLRLSVLPLIEEARPDLLLFLKADRATERNARALGQAGVPIALWTTDSLSRAPGQLSLERLAQKTFVMDRGDVYGKQRIWLPLGYEPQIFRPTSEKTRDVLFIGYLKQPYYRTRLRVLREVARQPWLRQFRCAFIGSTGSRRGDRRLARELPFPFLGFTSIQQYAGEIARARVCVNVHQDDGREPINPSFFSIPGSRVCQIADKRPYLQEWLKADEEFVAANVSEFAGELQDLLKSPTRILDIAEAGFRAASRGHTFSSRIATILDEMKETSR